MAISLSSPHGLAPAVITWGYASTTSASATITPFVSGQIFPGGIVGYGVSGPGIPTGTVVSSGTASGSGYSALVLSNAATVSTTSAGANLVFTSPITNVALPIGYQGQLVSDSFASFTRSLINAGATAIDFGSFVAFNDANSCKAPAADTDILIGIAQRRFKDSTVLSGVVNYAQYDAVPVLNQGPGMIWCVAAENVNVNDIAVSITAGNGTVGGRNLNNGKAVIGTPAFTGTGNGTLVMDTTTPLLTGYQDGTYTATCTVAGSNSATFRVTDPIGRVLGDVAFSGSGASVTFSNQIKFAITDGSTDFTVGAAFTIAINAGRVAANGVNGNIRAVWKDTVAVGNVGRVQIQSF